MTLPDDTEIVHSESIVKAGNEAVKAVVERPVDYGCISAVCRLPDYRWEQGKGFTAGEVAESEALIQRLAHIIIELARDESFEQASVIQGRLLKGLLGINVSNPLEPVHVHIPRFGQPLTPQRYGLLNPENV